MKNTRLFILLTLLLSVFTSTLFAQERSEETLHNIALNLIGVKDPQVQHSIKTENKVSNVKSLVSTKSKNYKIINLKPQGWVIVTTDDVATPIIGYSKTGSFELNESTPPALKAWLDNIDQNIKKAKKEGKDSSEHPTGSLKGVIPL